MGELLRYDGRLDQGSYKVYRLLSQAVRRLTLEGPGLWPAAGTLLSCPRIAVRAGERPNHSAILVHSIGWLCNRTKHGDNLLALDTNRGEERIELSASLAKRSENTPDGGMNGENPRDKIPCILATVSYAGKADSPLAIAEPLRSTAQLATLLEIATGLMADPAGSLEYAYERIAAAIGEPHQGSF